MALTDWIRPLFNIASQHGRRAHILNGRAHIELRTMSPQQHDAFVVRLEDALSLLEGVQRVDVNALLGRTVVAFDEEVCDLGWIVKVIDRVEQELGLDDVRFPIDRPEHPGDLEPLVRCLIELGGDAAGLVMAVVGRVGRLPTFALEIDALAVLSLFDAPRLRAAVEERLGRQTASFFLTLSNAVAQGLAQSPLGPVVDIAYHGLVLGERLARRRAWSGREAELCATGGGATLRQPEPPSRPVPLPAGPVERYADAALIASGGVFAVSLAATGRIAEATAPLLSALPKPARLGREAFASSLALVLALRGVVPLDRRALRRLDRVDCLVVPLDLLLAVGILPGSVVTARGFDRAMLRARIVALFDPCRSLKARHDGLWTLAPLAQHAEVDASAAGDCLLALWHADVVVAIARVQVTLDPDGEALVAAARRAGMRIVVAARAPIAVAGLDADEVVIDGPTLPDEVRRLQREGHVVCVLAAEQSGALAVADYGVGITRDGDRVPWGAHLLCTDRLDDARFLVEACRTARAASQQSVQLAGVGAGIGLLISLGGLSRETPGQVATSANVTSLMAIANGVRLSAALALQATPARRDTTPWHALDTAAAMERLRTSLRGLPSEEALRRRVAPESAPGTLAQLGATVVDQLRNPLTPLLAVGAGLSAAAGSVVDAGLVISVMALNAIVGAVQRLRTDRAIDGLSREAQQQVRVRRDGEERLVDPGAIVPGDVVLLRAGDAITADCRLVEQENVEVDESSLTGESLPVPKEVRASRAAAVAERSSMLYDGTAIAAGTATALVVAVGNATETRRAAHAARGRKPREGVEARLEAITSFMAPTAILGGIGVAAAGLLAGRPGREVLGAGTSLAVAAVPEGLPLLAMAAQLAAAQRLSLRGTLVRNPRTIEALGRVDVVCFDKTGTVTEGRLRLRSVWHAGGESLADRLDPPGRLTLAAALRATPEAVAGAALPHLTDRALVEAAERAAVTTGEEAPGWVRLAELPFEPARGYHAVLGRVAGELLLSVKGAPEVVLGRSRDWWRQDGMPAPLGPEERVRLGEQASRLAAEGLRVLAVGECALPLDATFDASSIAALTFLGFVAFSDPVRATAGDALRGLREAGVRALMMTGDHPSTAARIAAELEIADHASVCTGAEVDDMDDEALDACLRRTHVFARVSPGHKVRLVGALQRAGHTVAMTGDGANDAGAIRLANVGIALGGHGTTAALDVADLVVTDDRIETIVDAVLEGRAMWVSVRDAVAVLVGGNLGELGFSVAAGILGGASPLNARQLLLVNLLTDVAPAMAIALRPPPHTTAQALLHEGPEASLASPLTADIAWRALVTGAGAGGAWLATRLRASAAESGTVALVALVGAQLGQTLATGGRSPLVIGTSVGSLAALVGIVQTPGLSQLCGCTPLGPTGWTTGITAAAAATGASVVVPWLWPEAKVWVEGHAGTLRNAWPSRWRQLVGTPALGPAAS